MKLSPSTVAKFHTNQQCFKSFMYLLHIFYTLHTKHHNSMVIANHQQIISKPDMEDYNDSVNDTTLNSPKHKHVLTDSCRVPHLSREYT